MNRFFSSANSIVMAEVIAAFFPGVKLQRDGNSRHKAICLFHQESTASFTVTSADSNALPAGPEGRILTSF